MTATAEADPRIEALEERARRLEHRLLRLETRAGAPVAVPAPAPRPIPAPAPAPARREPPARPRPVVAVPAPPALSLEDLLGGRVLAWVGGVAVLVGIVLLLVIASSNGWIGEGARTAMGATASLGLLVASLRLRDRHRRTEAALAAGAAGVAGLFACVVVASQVYALIPAAAGLALAVAVGAVATSLAVRWAAPGMAALGIGGALLAPVLVGAELDGGALALVAVATASATGVLLWQRWNWLAFGTFALATPQWLGWVLDGQRPLPTLAALAIFGVLNLVAAAGFELRSRARLLRTSAAALLALNAFVLAAGGWFALAGTHGTVARAWLVVLALAHLGAGLAGRRHERVSSELAFVALGLGVALADVALSVIASGPVLAVSWAAGAAGFAAVRRGTGAKGGAEPFAALGIGAHLALALGHALLEQPPAQALSGTAPDPGVILALGAVIASCFVSGRLAEAGHHTWRVLLDSLGLAVLAYATAVSLDGAALALAWAAEAVALAGLARRAGDHVAGWGALAFLAGAGLEAVAVCAPPAALLVGVTDALPAATALAAFAAAAVLARGALDRPGVQTGLLAAAALAVLHLVSIELVTGLLGTGGGAPAFVGEGARQQAQTALSGLWALCGVGILIAGLVRDVRSLRLGALLLLGVTASKVFLFDLASLTSIYRVASFVALGLLLLSGAFAWQRLRPRMPLTDARAA